MKLTKEMLTEMVKEVIQEQVELQPYSYSRCHEDALKIIDCFNRMEGALYDLSIYSENKQFNVIKEKLKLIRKLFEEIASKQDLLD